MHANDLAQFVKNIERTTNSRDKQLNTAESLMVEAAFAGDIADCARLNDKGSNPGEADSWGEERRIRAAVIFELCTNAVALKHINQRGIQLYGADIINDLDLSFAAIPFPLALRRCRLRHPVKLTSAQLTQLDLAGSLAPSILAADVIVRHNVVLSDGFTCNGEVRLIGADIGGNLTCSNGVFTNPLSDDAINLLSDEPTSGRALRLSGMRVKGDVLLDKVRVTGATRILSAQIGGSLNCDGGHFIVPIEQQQMHRPEMSTALSAERIAVTDDVLLRYDFTAAGWVDFLEARIGGTLWCDGANFSEAGIDFRNASAASLDDTGLNDLPPTVDPRDYRQTIWPKRGQIDLDGFSYKRISSVGRLNVAKRLYEWLDLQVPFRSQPYLQLAAVLNDAGDSEGRRTVLIHEEYTRRRYEDRFLQKPLSIGYGVLVGYGYRPLWAVAEIVGLGALGWIIYRRSYLAGGIVPTDKEACEEFRQQNGRIPSYYPSFSPLMYSIENSLPLVKLGQTDHWQPDPEPAHPLRGVTLGRRGAWQEQNTKYSQCASSNTVFGSDGNEAVEARVAPCVNGETVAAAALILHGETKQQSSVGWRATLALRERLIATMKRLLIAFGLSASDDATYHPSPSRNFGTSPRFVLGFRWLQILLGWLLATLFVAGVSGIVHKE
jgi:hypothetical protein